MKRLIFIIGLILAANTAFAATGQLNAQIIINGVPISSVTEQNMTMKVAKVAGQLSYVTADFKSVVPAHIKATQELVAYSITSISTPITLTKGSDTASLDLTCRIATGAYVTTVANGVDCSTPMATPDGLLYISIYPTAVTFSSANTVGAYAGTITVTTNFQ